MFDHVIKIGFVVENVEKAVEFYTQITDLKVLWRFPSDTGEDFVFLKSKTLFVELLPKSFFPDEPVGFHHMAFEVDDVDKRINELKTRGAKILAEPFDAGVGGIRLGDFEGPGGVLLRLFHKAEKP